ncbi:sugar transferase [Niameybacter massiliensis]|uniref:sugar transferase n=1 Tax=Niameybacter massiliensis TaxID=1658108 RepID=UPI0006B440E9|nr:sugar transferase [Niameybacter massiliensis]
MYIKVKGFIDRFMALILIIIGSPIMALAALAIKIEDPKGTIFFRQTRPGKAEQIFTIYKFRTMRTPAEEEKGDTQYDIVRTTRVGKFLRKTSIDELPQFLNVLKGNMSFIGPRPLLEEYLPCYTEEQHRRHEVKPGISGWAQVNGRNAITWEQKFELDVWYVDHISLKTDLYIVYKTLKNVLCRKDVNNSQDTTMPAFNSVG